jgi:hypothetical protein
MGGIGVSQDEIHIEVGRGARIGEKIVGIPGYADAVLPQNTQRGAAGAFTIIIDPKSTQKIFAALRRS